MLRAIKIRLYPNSEQTTMIDKLLGYYRVVYNQCLNRKIVFVNRFYPSSKTCNNCGYINKKLKLSDRQWVCPQCGEVIERDYNAALNILDEGLRLIGCSTSEFTLVDYPTVDDILSNEVLKSGGRLKQEVNNEQTSFVQVLTYCIFL